MGLGEIILIGLSLSMDAFAVSVSSSMAYPGLSRIKKLSMPAAFGLFQGIMPILGYYLGTFFAAFINKYAGLVAFIILALIGANMIKEGITGDEESSGGEFTIKVLLMQAVATSIDAFAVGVSFAATGAAIWSSSAIIAATTFICSLIAVAAGAKIGEKAGNKAVIAGGAVLIAIGVKSLFM